MQNRLVITGIPASVIRRPNSADSLRDLIEEHGCWADRFAFLEPSINSDLIAAAAELHIENVRDDAVRSLDGLTVVLDESGLLLSSSKDSDADSNNTSNGRVIFMIGAAPANKSQSKQLLRRCPIQNDDGEHLSAMERQTLVLPIVDLRLTVRCNIEDGGGTGSTPWRGGLLLSHHICRWYQQRDHTTTTVNFKSLFHGKTVLELGAGCSGLPSMTLAKIATTYDYDMTIICSDGVDEIVDALHTNIQENGLHDCINVHQIDWNHYCTETNEKQHANFFDTKADTILFADCIYNDKCAVALSRTIFRLIRSGGCIIGVVPDNRVGVNIFEKCMKHYTTTELPIHVESNQISDGFVCTGGGGRNYRLIRFDA